MMQPAKSQPSLPEPMPYDPYPDYPQGFTWLFQAWLILFLAVICFALFFYLLGYIPK